MCQCRAVSTYSLKSMYTLKENKHCMIMKHHKSLNNKFLLFPFLYFLIFPKHIHGECCLDYSYRCYTEDLDINHNKLRLPAF